MGGRRLRVLFVSHTYVVGVNQRKLHALAAREGIEVGLLAPARWRAWGRRFDLERPYPEVRVYGIPVWLEGRRSGYFFAPWTLRRILAEFRPDLVQVEGEAFAIVAWEVAALARLARAPVAVFCWENIDLPLSLPRRCIRWFVLRAARLVIAGNKEAGALVRRCGFTGPVEVMPQLGVDADLFRPRLQDRNGSVPVVGFVGRLTYEKGIDLLLDAARLLWERAVPFRLVLCGTGPDEEKLHRAAAERGIAHLVTWRGHVFHHQVPEEMKVFDVLVLPSRSVPGWKEQFGHVLIEAMSMGIAVIGSSSGEIPYVIGRDDLVFPEGDSSALADALERILRDGELQKEAGKYGIARVRALYTDERIAERLVEVWRRALQEPVTTA